jgi:hypothetical protein
MAKDNDDIDRLLDSYDQQRKIAANQNARRDATQQAWRAEFGAWARDVAMPAFAAFEEQLSGRGHQLRVSEYKQAGEDEENAAEMFLKLRDDGGSGVLRIIRGNVDKHVAIERSLDGGFYRGTGDFRELTPDWLNEAARNLIRDTLNGRT